MRTTVTLMLALALGVGSTACKKDKEKAPAAGSAAMAGAGDMAGSAGAGDMAGSAGGAGDMAGSAAAGSGAEPPAEPQMAKNAGNCPSMVFGATTQAEGKGKDVVLTITATDKDAVASIQRRTEALLKEKQDGGTGAGHDQKGSQGGAGGICPVFLGEGGTAKSKKVAKGVTITITPKDKPEELKATIDERISKASAWVEKNIKPGEEGNKGAVGGGKGAHGSTHQGAGDAKGKDREGGTGGGAGTGGGGGKGTGGGGKGGEKKDAAK